MNKKYFSIVICTFNRPKKCIRTIKKILEQKFDDFSSLEIIVVDDNSDNQNSLIIKEFLNNKDIKYFRHQKNYGLSKARNTGIKNCNGKWFAFCDDDDYWPQGYLSKVNKIIKESKDDVGIVLGFSKKYFSSYNKLIKKNNKLSNLILSGITPPVASQFYKKELVDNVGGYNENIKSGVDHDLWISMVDKLNPYVDIAWGAEPKVSKEYNLSRMTLNEIKRRKGIADSLIIWRETLVNRFGLKFYKHFCDSYMSYVEFTFFIKRLPNLNLLILCKIFTNKYYFFYFRKTFLKLFKFNICNNFKNFY